MQCWCHQPISFHNVSLGVCFCVDTRIDRKSLAAFWKRKNPNILNIKFLRIKQKCMLHYFNFIFGYASSSFLVLMNWSCHNQIMNCALCSVKKLMNRVSGTENQGWKILNLFKNYFNPPHWQKQLSKSPSIRPWIAKHDLLHSKWIYLKINSLNWNEHGLVS